MRVVHVIPSYWPALRYGGTVVASRALVAAQTRRGDQVTVLTTTSNGDRPLFPEALRVERVDQAEVRYARVRWQRLYWSPLMGRDMRPALRSAEVAHLHSVFLWPTWKASRLAASLAVPSVLSPRGMLVRQLIAARSTLVKRLWIAGIERANLRRAALIHVTSDRERDDLIELDLIARDRIRVVPNGVDLPDLFGLERDPSLVLFVGRLSWKKGLPVLIEAMARLPGLRLLIAGQDDESLRPQLERQIATLGLASRVHILGAIDASERDRLMQTAAVLVVPSRNENFGNVVVEAMANQCPVVCTDGVGASTHVRGADAGRVCVQSPEALAAAVSEVIAVGADNRLGRAGREYVARELGWSRVAEDMDLLYAEAVALGRIENRRSKA